MSRGAGSSAPLSLGRWIQRRYSHSRRLELMVGAKGYRYRPEALEQGEDIS